MAAPAITVPPFAIPCETVPTKADLTNFFGQLASLPSQLEVAAVAAGTEFAAEQTKELRAEAARIRTMLEPIRKLLSKYDPRHPSTDNPEKDWEVMITRLMQEFYIYVPTTIMELIGKLGIPVELEVTVMGITIDLIAFVSDPAYRAELKEQFSASELIYALVGPTIEELKEAYEERAKIVNGYYNLVTSTYQTHSGKYGSTSTDQKAEVVWSFVQNQIQSFAIGFLQSAFGELIKGFQSAWDNIPGLPDIPLDGPPDIAGLLKAFIDAWIAEAEERGAVIWGELVTALEEFVIPVPPLFPTLKELVGGAIKERTTDPEQQIDRLIEAARDFGDNFVMELLRKWMALVTKFFEVIGLDIAYLITFNFCDFLELIGFPTEIDLSSFPSVSEEVAV